MLRHAAASLFIAYLGWTPKRIHAVMGHASVSMTFDLYGHLFENKEADRSAMEKIEAAITAASDGRHKCDMGTVSTINSTPDYTLLS